MKRLALVVTVLLVLAGCSDGDDAVVTVNDTVVLTQDDWQAELDQLADSDDALTSLDGRGAGAGTLSAGFVSSVLDNHVLRAVVDELVAAEDVTVEPADVEAGEQILTSQLASLEAPLDLEEVPSRYRDLLVELYGGYAALIVHFGGDVSNPNTPESQAAAEQIGVSLLEAREAASVEIAPRYGRWDTAQDRPQVAPPEGPVTPTTVPLAVPAGG